MFALCRPKYQGSTPREHPEIFAQSDPPPVDLSVGDIRSQTAAERLQRNGHNGEPIGNHHRSFERCHHWPLTTSPSPKMGVQYDPKIREWPYLRNGWSDTLHVWFYGRVFKVGGSNGAISGYPTSNPSWRQAAILDNFEWPYLATAHSIHLYSAHREVIFATAQLSCLCWYC